MKVTTQRALRSEAQLNAQIVNLSTQDNFVIITIKDDNLYQSIYLSIEDILEFERAGQNRFTSVDAALNDARARLDSELALMELDLASEG